MIPDIAYAAISVMFTTELIVITTAIGIIHHFMRVEKTNNL